MKAVKVDRVKLLTKVKENRRKHLEAFETAMKGHRTALANRLVKIAEEASARVETLMHENVPDKELRTLAGDFDIDLPEPQNHTKDYDQVVAMLDMSVEQELDIDAECFACYVLDEWSWKEIFIATSAHYAGTR